MARPRGRDGRRDPQTLVKKRVVLVNDAETGDLDPGPFDLRGSELFRAFTSKPGYPAYHFASVFATSDDALYVGLDAVHRGADLDNEFVASLRRRMSPTSQMEWVRMWLDPFPEITISKILVPPPSDDTDGIIWG
jgi:hypothetical protein